MIGILLPEFSPHLYTGWAKWWYVASAYQGVGLPYSTFGKEEELDMLFEGL